MKTAVLWVLGLFALGAGAASTPSVVAGFHGGGGLLGVAESVAAPPMHVRWTFSTQQDELALAPAPTTSATVPAHAGAAGIEGSPVIADGVAFVAAQSGGLYAIDLASGKRRWVYRAEGGFGTSPLVMGGRVYIGDLDGTFHAVSQTDGRKLWTFDAGNSIHSSANAANGNIVFGTDGADIFCLSPDGKQIWNAKAGDRINGAPAVAGGCVMVSGCDSQLRTLDASGGQERSATDLGALAPGSPAVLPDRIVVGLDQGRVVCLPIGGGKEIWSFEGIENHAMVFGSPAVAEGTVVFGARDRNVYGLDLATGALRWKFATRGDVDASPEISAGRVYVGSKDKHLYVLDLRSGKKLWEFNAARPIVAGVGIGEGVVLVADTAGKVRCLEPDSK